MVCDGSRPNALATSLPNLPAGGSYCSVTVSCVPESVPRAGSKVTEPALTTSPPGSDFHASTLFWISLMISASHSTRKPPGPRATQCERPPPRSVTSARFSMNVGRFSSRDQKR